ncbi:MAG: Flp pilus assembly complex ATPase component TadA [Alphaproteobacteria bacterium]|nr:Flp pilus assembly complex ATPase component TadA [Alphaproteobacteria bacterium]
MIQGAALAYRTRYSRICPVDNAIALKNDLRPLEPYLELTGTNEVIVNRENEVVLETASGWEFVPDGNITKEMFLSIGRILANRAGTDFDAHPYLGAELPDGHRLHLCMGTTVESGLCSAIRLKRSRKLTIDNFLTEKSFAPKPEMTFDFDDIPNSLKRLVLEKRNILISGATSSGKTNLLNVLLKYVPKTDRFLSMEDVRELDTSHLLNTVHFVLPDNGNCRSGETSCSGNSIDQNDVIDAMMRLRPDRIACGELRSRNTWTLLSLLNNGHGGCMTTIHAGSPYHAISKVITNAMTGDKCVDKDVMEKIVKECLDCVIQIKVSEGERYISDIALRGRDY